MRRASIRSYPVRIVVVGIALVMLSGCGPHKPIVVEYDFSKMKKGTRTGLFGDFMQSAINRESYELDDGKLIIHGQPRGKKYRGHQMQFEAFGKTGFVKLEAAADHWAPNTSLGFEVWGNRRGAPTYDGIVLKGGALKIVNSTIVGVGDIILPVTDWDELKKEFHTIELRWDKSAVTLKIDGKIEAYYSGRAVPDEYMRFHINADVGQDDRLLIKNLYLSRG